MKKNYSMVVTIKKKIEQMKMQFRSRYTCKQPQHNLVLTLVFLNLFPPFLKRLWVLIQMEIISNIEIQDGRSSSSTVGPLAGIELTPLR